MRTWICTAAKMPRKARAAKAAALPIKTPILCTTRATNTALPAAKTVNYTKQQYSMENITRNLTVETKENIYAVADGVTGMKIVFVNVYFVRGSDGPGGNWVLVDAGLYGSAQRIK